MSTGPDRRSPSFRVMVRDPVIRGFPAGRTGAKPSGGAKPSDGGYQEPELPPPPPPPTLPPEKPPPPKLPPPNPLPPPELDGAVYVLAHDGPMLYTSRGPVDSSAGDTLDARIARSHASAAPRATAHAESSRS